MRVVPLDGRPSIELHDCGEYLEACREPINVVSSSSNPLARMISNFAPTPTGLDMMSLVIAGDR
jgi:hypothetical protein